MSTLAIKRSRMLSLVEQWRASGQTQQAFCQFHGIKLGTLAYWVRTTPHRFMPSGIISTRRLPAEEDFGATLNK